MSKTITLPSGNTAVIKDPKKLLAKDRKRIYELANDDTGMMKALTMVEATVAIIIESWSFDLMLPSIRLSILGELSIDDYDALVKESTEAQQVLFANYNTDEGADSPLDKLDDILQPSKGKDILS